MKTETQAAIYTRGPSIPQQYREIAAPLSQIANIVEFLAIEYRKLSSEEQTYAQGAKKVFSNLTESNHHQALESLVPLLSHFVKDSTYEKVQAFANAALAIIYSTGIATKNDTHAKLFILSYLKQALRLGGLSATLMTTAEELKGYILSLPSAFHAPAPPAKPARGNFSARAEQTSDRSTCKRSYTEG